jgi:hypothetical protein
MRNTGLVGFNVSPCSTFVVVDLFFEHGKSAAFSTAVVEQAENIKLKLTDFNNWCTAMKQCEVSSLPVKGDT